MMKDEDEREAPVYPISGTNALWNYFRLLTEALILY
jgi:hypothetical protein